MGVVASGAGGLHIHDVEAVTAILAEGGRLSADTSKALVRQDAVATVTFVAKGVGAGPFGGIIGELELAFEDRRKQRTVGTTRAGATSARALVVIVTIGASHETAERERGNKTWNIRILAGSFKRMEGSVGGREWEAFIGLGNLTGDESGAPRGAIAMTTIAKLGFLGDWIHHRATDGANTFDANERTGSMQ